jgi:hypothetical protein
MDTVGGIPAHPFIVHAVVVLVPLTAVGAVLVALVPWVRAHVGWLVAAGAVLDVVLAPLATSSGESLEERVRETGAMERHAEMGGQLTPWVVGLAIGAVAVMVLARATAGVNGSSAPWAARWVSVLVAAVTIVAASGAMVQVVRIGHSGAEATWSNVGPAGG